MRRVQVLLFNTGGSGRTPDKALSINFQNNGATVAFVNEIDIPAGQSVNYPYNEGWFYGSFDYDGNGGNLLISGSYAPMQ